MIRAQLARIEQSAFFAGSDRLRVLLRFIVIEALEGHADTLREAAIGNAVYGREPPYDPRIDSTVRVEVRRLRRKLQEYYAGEGAADPVRIALPVGSYVPVFGAGGQLPANADRAQPHLFEKGRGAALAIMPLRALSGEAADEGFADGLTDELIFLFGNSPGLRVISRSTSFQYKDRPYSLAALARELGVDAILHGSVRRAGHVLRVTVEVSDPNGFVVSSDRFDAPDDDPVRLQEDIATTMVNRAQIDASAMRNLQIRPMAGALEEKARVYRARQLLDQQTPKALREAVTIFAQLTYPDYARGYSGLADAHCDLYRLGLIDHAAAVAAAKPAVRRALEIDPGSPEALGAAATVAAWLDWDREAADLGFQRALQAGRNARVARLYAVFLTILQRHEEAERLFRTARALEPFSAQQDIAEAVGHYQARRYRLLMDARPIQGTEPANPEAMVLVALAQIFGGRPEAARLTLTGLDAGDALPDLAFIQAEIEAWLGEPERGRRLLAAAPGRASCFAQAALAAALGEEGRCLDAVAAMIDRRELSRAWLRTDPRFDRLRALPRFQELLTRLG